MSQENNYGEETVDKIIRYLKQWDSDNRFKKFIDGADSDMEISTEDMPCIVIDHMKTHVEQGPTGADKVTETIRLMLVLNRKTYMDDFDENTWSWKKMLRLMVQGNDPLNNQYDPTSVLGVLRVNFTMGNYVLDQTMDISYGEVARNGQDETTGEGWITMVIEHFQQTPVKV